MSYRIRPDAKPYVVIAGGGQAGVGRKLGDGLVALALPDEEAVPT
jgi:glucose dehydrogenase